jgi:hypothetical protein
VRDDSENGHDDPRWEYKVLWRYGALLLVGVGLTAMAVAIAGVAKTAVSVTVLPIGFVSLVAGVVLPRIEGRFTAGPSGLSAEMLAVHELDRQPRFYASGPAVDRSSDLSGRAISTSEPTAASGSPPRVTIGDVWDALDEAGVQLDGAGMGHAYFRLRGNRHLDMPNKTFMDWATASSDLLGVLETWGVHPVASGKYPAPDSVALDGVEPRGRLMSIPNASERPGQD